MDLQRMQDARLSLPTPADQISSQEWWSIREQGDDTPEISLHQYGWSVTSKGGNRYDLPTKRGDNQEYPYRPGARHNQNKLAKQRSVVLDMWLMAVNPGTGQIDGDLTVRWNDSWDFLRELMWQFSGQQLILTRRWLRTIQGNKVLHKAEALVEMTDTMEPTMTGPHRATFQLKFTMADPFYYGDWITTRIDMGAPAQNIYNPGQERAMYSNIEVRITNATGSPVTNPKIINYTPTPNIYLKWASVLNVGTLVFDIPNSTCFNSTHTTNYIRYVVSSGDQFWFGLNPGNNLIELVEDTSVFMYGATNRAVSERVEEAEHIREAGVAYAMLKFRPAYL